jgi:uncharacterized protein YdiU (UPF0061 family)
MDKYKADYTNTFLALTNNTIEEGSLYENNDFVRWHIAWKNRLKRQDASEKSVIKLMRQSNPAVIPRNHRVEEALEAAEREAAKVMRKLLDILSRPYAHTPDQAEYSAPPAPSACPYQTFCGT